MFYFQVYDFNSDSQLYFSPNNLYAYMPKSLISKSNGVMVNGFDKPTTTTTTTRSVGRKKRDSSVPECQKACEHINQAITSNLLGIGKQMYEYCISNCGFSNNNSK